jgi:hypothetical protein
MVTYFDDSNKEKMSSGGELGGRPFTQEEAEGYFRRLKNSGCSCIRFALPWKAVEREEGAYDEDYLAYLRKIFVAADGQELPVFIDSRGGGAGKELRGGEGAERIRERYLEALRHAYRRLKNCKAIEGWAIPDGLGDEFVQRFTRRMREVNPKLRIFTNDIPGAS